MLLYSNVASSLYSFKSVSHLLYKVMVQLAALTLRYIREDMWEDKGR